MRRSPSPRVSIRPMSNLEDVTIRDYRPGDGPRVIDLLNDVFVEGDPNYSPRTLEQWQWIYEQNPAGNEIVVAEAPDGRIAGHYACIPYRIQIAGEPRTCGQGVDSMVRAEYRRGLKTEGLFLRVAKAYFDRYGVPENHAYGYGFPNQRAYRIGVRILKYSPVHTPVVTLGRNLFDKSADTEVGLGADEAGSVVELERCDARVDRLWSRISPEVGMGTIRDAEFLNWRFLDCPFGPHSAHGLLDADQELRGLYIARDNWAGPPIEALVEFLVPSEDAGAAIRLIRHAVERARSIGQQRVELWIPPRHPHFSLLLGHGFVSEDSPFNLCVKIYDTGLELDWVRDSWYYSIGDTDVF